VNTALLPRAFLREGSRGAFPAKGRLLDSKAILPSLRDLSALSVSLPRASKGALSFRSFNVPLDAGQSLLTPFPATHAKNASVTPFPATHTNSPHCKSFPCHTSEKKGVSPQLRLTRHPMKDVCPDDSGRRDLLRSSDPVKDFYPNRPPCVLPPRLSSRAQPRDLLFSCVRVPTTPRGGNPNRRNIQPAR
jgi:hypothetical protein